jgi:hypothetical protein
MDLLGLRLLALVDECDELLQQPMTFRQAFVLTIAYLRAAKFPRGLHVGAWTAAKGVLPPSSRRVRFAALPQMIEVEDLRSCKLLWHSECDFEEHCWDCGKDWHPSRKVAYEETDDGDEGDYDVVVLCRSCAHHAVLAEDDEEGMPCRACCGSGRSGVCNIFGTFCCI